MYCVACVAGCCSWVLCIAVLFVCGLLFVVVYCCFLFVVL